MGPGFTDEQPGVAGAPVWNNVIPETTFTELDSRRAIGLVDILWIMEPSAFPNNSIPRRETSDFFITMHHLNGTMCSDAKSRCALPVMTAPACSGAV